MGFQCGIVGLPNVGKSTLFNALTSAGIAAENFPFCTIEPNTGVVPVPDTRLGEIAEIASSAKRIPATVEFIDIAGLVRGAASGEGLGNQFLGHIRNTQAIAQVVRCFENPDITHVDGRIDPLEDIATINTELALADLESCQRALERLNGQVRSGDTEAVARVELLKFLITTLNDGQPLRTLSLDERQRDRLRDYQLLTIKPVLYIANTTEANDTCPADLQQLAEAEGAPVISICTPLEAEIAELPVDDRAEFLEAMELAEASLDRVIRAGYELLGLHTFFTASEKEARAWTIPRNMQAPQAAGTIHTDFERGFIRAEVISYTDYLACNGEAGCREQGKLRIEGKDYQVQDGDVIHFRFNV